MNGIWSHLRRRIRDAMQLLVAARIGQSVFELFRTPS
ncbi:MAG: hypothetical protein ACI9W2_004554, partial [Gammaproteobacteria bacterium]